MDFSPIPIIDHHCHAVRRFDHPLGLDEFRAFFAETTDPQMPPHIARTVLYMRMVRAVAAVLACHASEEALLGAAYRGGLQVERRSFEEANAVFPALKELARRYSRVRLSDRAMLDYLLRAALEEAAAVEMPVQFHVAFGDDDADLRTSNPLQLRN